MKQKNTNFDPINTHSDLINTLVDPIKKKLYQAIIENGALNYAAYAAVVGVS